MGVDPKWGRFPICPECPVLSPFVLIRPDLSPFWASKKTKEDKRGHIPRMTPGRLLDIRPENFLFGLLF